MTIHSALNPHDAVLPLFFPSALVQFMSHQGVDPNALLADTGLVLAGLEQPEARASFYQVQQLIANAEIAWGTSGLGLEFGSSLTVMSLGMIGQAALSSATIGKALETIVRYLTLRDPLQSFLIERQANGALFVFNSPIALGSAQNFIVDASFSSVLVLAEQLAGTPINGLEFHVQRNRGPETLIHDDILGPNLRFNNSRDAFYVPVEVLDLLVPTANVMSSREARQYCDAELLRIDRSLGLNSVVRTLIKSSLRAPPNEAQAAKVLGHSERNLRRRLANENTGYRELLREVRQDAAQTLLSSTHLSVEGIAWELGYQNAGNFCRAFKQWTGKTPSEVRRSLAERVS